jgi:signal transduction histidine kinase
MTPGSRRTVVQVVAAVLLLVGGVAWISAAALRYARKEAEARQKAAVEETVRVALWRLDSFVAPTLARAHLVSQDGGGELGPFIRSVRLLGPPECRPVEDHIRRAGPQEPAPPPMLQQAQNGAQYQSLRSSQEWAARAKNVGQQVKSSVGLPLDAPIELLRPLWMERDLVLARRAPGGVLLAKLDWPMLQRRLPLEIADLFPYARVEPAGSGGNERLLASLPVRLEPGPLARPVPDDGSPVWLGLGLAWTSVLLAVGAVVTLLLGAVALSERRAVFVSAVTHELRTPLTTFRTYTEMLARGMVPEASRADYLETLRREADRLAHLTENVLLYARLERGPGGHRVEEVELGALLDRVRPRLESRAAQAGMTLAVADLEARVRGDATAIEQILFNAVDNACKYAAAADDKQIRIEGRPEGGRVVVEVSDGGPGIPPEDRRRLFQPFSRSARDAAGRAPGVGLGLALSRRLARAMGGDLELVERNAGACFRLTLPVV